MTSIPASFVILHGWRNRRPAGHWQHWLARELAARGSHVHYPQLPDPEDPDLDAWVDRVRTLLTARPDGRDTERVVVCHSLAAAVWLHAAARGVVRADRVLLVAPPSAEVLRRHAEVAAFAPAGTAPGHLASAAGTTRLAAGDDDPYCPGGAARIYGRPLGLDTDVIPGGGHLDPDAGYGRWPSVLGWCLDPAVRITARPTPA
ncbi:RBBP9/YdeN family alpha/beta hydrolase [Streptomyces sp. NPDC086783]|uniref:RBBP9/YdeN family alpha/beta hydrolase n=1 Tax=Streptomyces sp. NPDC086783 TaxID=3365758 RepID=UPI0037FC67B3